MRGAEEMEGDLISLDVQHFCTQEKQCREKSPDVGVAGAVRSFYVCS